MAARELEAAGLHYPDPSEIGTAEALAPAGVPLVNGGQSPHLPYDLEITGWQSKEPFYVPGVAEVHTTIVSVRDLSPAGQKSRESKFVLRKFVPVNQAWGISTDGGLPLGVRVKGFPTYMGLKLAEAGVHSRVVGTNQGHGFTLLHDAQATLAILGRDDAEQAEKGQTCEAGKSNLQGYSMGSMKGFGIVALSRLMKRDMGFFLALDPCLMEKFDYDEAVRHLPSHLAYLGREVLEVGNNFWHDLREDAKHGRPDKAFRRYGHLAATFGLNPDYIMNTADKWNTLATGETGELVKLVAENNPEAVMLIHFFKRSRFNDNAAYAEALCGLPNTRCIPEDAYHLSGARSSVVSKVVSKNVTGLRLQSEGARPAEIVSALSGPIMTSAARL